MRQKLEQKTELISHNCVARTFTSIVRDMTQKQMGMTRGYNTESRWTLEHKSKEGSPFQVSEGKDGAFLCKRLYDSYLTLM